MVTTGYVDKIAPLGRQLSDATILMHEAIARNAGLTGTDHKYLRMILDEGTLTAGELAKLTGLTTGAVTGLIDRLEKDDLVARQFDRTDRRKILIVANAVKADQLFATAHADLGGQIKELLSKFSPKEIKTIEQYLLGTVEIMNNVTRTLNEKNNGRTSDK